MGKRMDYREELTRRASECAGELLDNAKTGARFPVLPTLELLKRAWIDGYRAGSRPDWSDATKKQTRSEK